MGRKQEGDLTMQELAAQKETVYKSWSEIAENAGEYLQDLSGEIAFVAGGALPTRFGIEDSEIWQAISAKIEESDGELVTIAGIDFTRQDLESMGKFYRFLGEKGHKLHCIDERLEDDIESKDM